MVNDVLEDQLDADKYKKISFNINIGFFTRSSRVYIVERIALLISLLLLVVGSVQLFNALIDYFMSDRLDSIYGYGLVSFEELVGYLSLAVVVTPVFGLLYIRTRRAEREFPKVFESRAARRLSYFFMTLSIITLVFYAIAFVYLSLSRLLGLEDVYASDSWLQSAIKIVFAMIIVGAAGLLVAKSSPGLGKGVK